MQNLHLKKEILEKEIFAFKKNSPYLLNNPRVHYPW